jgi:hypothetical protein
MTARKTESKLIRMAVEDADLIVEAAKILGLSMSSFLVYAGLDRAKEVIVKTMRTTHDLSLLGEKEEPDATSEERLHILESINQKYGIPFDKKQLKKKCDSKDLMKSFGSWSLEFSQFCEDKFGPIPAKEKDFEAYVNKVHETLSRKRRG